MRPPVRLSTLLVLLISSWTVASGVRSAQLGRNAALIRNLLITLLVSNNFVELKGNVFKKCERENLFQVACADIVERFQLSVYLSIVCLQFVFVQKVEATRAEWRYEVRPEMVAWVSVPPLR